MKRGTIQKGTIRGTTEGRFVETTTTTNDGTILVNRRLAVLRRRTRLHLGTRLFSPYALWNRAGLVRGRRSRRWRRGSRRPRRPSRTFPTRDGVAAYRRAESTIARGSTRARGGYFLGGDGGGGGGRGRFAGRARGGGGGVARVGRRRRRARRGERAAAEAMLRDEDRRGDAESARDGGGDRCGRRGEERERHGRRRGEIAIVLPAHASRRGVRLARRETRKTQSRIDAREPEPVDTSAFRRRNRGFGTWRPTAERARRRFGRARVARGGDGIVRRTFCRARARRRRSSGRTRTRRSRSSERTRGPTRGSLPTRGRKSPRRRRVFRRRLRGTRRHPSSRIRPRTRRRRNVDPSSRGYPPRRRCRCRQRRRCRRCRR